MRPSTSKVPPLEAVVLTWNSVSEIEICLRSMAACFKEYQPGGVIHVVDNGSTDGTVAMVEALAEEIAGVEIRCHPLGENTGTTFSRNVALKQVTAPFLLVADSDTEFPPGSITALVKTLKSHSLAGLVAPQLFFPDGEEQENCRRFPTIWTKVLRTLVARFGVGERLREKNESYAPQPSLEVDCAISACWMLRKAAVDQIGLLDEEIFYSPEDTDYCVRLRLGGWKLVWDRRIKVTHHTKRLSHKGFFNSHARSHTLGLRYFWRKHDFRWRREGLYARFPAAPSVAEEQGVEESSSDEVRLQA